MADSTRTTPTKPRGYDFSRFSPEARKANASKGGKAAHQRGTAYEWTTATAAAAGSKGGLTTHRRRREREEAHRRKQAEAMCDCGGVVAGGITHEPACAVYREPVRTPAGDTGE